MTALVVDIGNSRIKWALARDSALQSSPQAVTHDDIDSLWAAWARLKPAPVSARCVSVANPAMTASLADWMTQQWGISLEAVSTPATPALAGLTLGYTHPVQLGADRWLAMRAAQYQSLLPAMIIDAGSAITIDYVDRHGQHRGGLIMAGLSAQRAGLQAITPALPQWSESPADGPPRLLADNTVEGLRSGAINGTAAALDELIHRLIQDTIQVEQGITPVAGKDSVLMTGGDAAVLAAAMRTPTQTHPNLVLEGLATIA